MPKVLAETSVNGLSHSKLISPDNHIDGMKSDRLPAETESGCMEFKKSLEPVLEPILNKTTDRKSVVTLPKTTKMVAKHGLAPVGMTIPLQKKAYRVGGSDSAKHPLKESNNEKYHRIKAEQEERKKKKKTRAANKLKKAGKVATLAPFMFF